MMMILQTRANVTARELAAELEVSERTVYRDVTALSIAGVPVYTERGPGGGIRLVDEYRSNLTGLTREEVQALYMISVPEPLTQLGFGQELHAAMLKLAASLPSFLRSDQELARQRVLIDPEPWEHDRRTLPVPFLHTVQKAVWEGLIIQVRYQLVAGPQIDSLRVVLHPYGLVAKAGKWYLVAWNIDHPTVLRVDSIVEAQILDESFILPPDFNLQSFWQEWCSLQSSYQYAFNVRMRVHPDLISSMSGYIADGIQAIFFDEETNDKKGWITCEVRFDSHEEARRRLLGFGGAVEVIEPIALRYSLKDYAEQILAEYADQV
jgi:predicted DNA-binding transcriptional regulator YafY